VSGDPIHVVGGGLAGSEAAFQLAARGHAVVLHELRGAPGGPGTPAHRTDQLAELVCSNTFKSTDVTNAHGLLKAEMRALGSLVLACADDARIPAGTALAVDRDLFSAAVHARVHAHPGITVVRDEVTSLPAVGIVATGPLTSDALAAAIGARIGEASLAFYDAIAPVIATESIDTSIAFRAARWNKETMAEAGPEGAYLNCPMDREEYDAFIAAMVAADLYHSHEFEAIPYFEGCMPVEEMARRGPETLRHGPMRPVGLRDPRTGKRPWAVLQLRQEDRAGRMWNLVGCQTRMRYPEQTSVFRLVPGLGRAEFLRYGSIHRNSYLNAPKVLSPHLALRDAPTTLFAGQLTGVEGYTESTATGLLAAINLDRLVRGLDPVVPPPTTMLGALYRHLREADPAHFQPMNANFGLLEELPDPPRDKDLKRERYAERALRILESWRQESGIVRPPVVEGVP
jgi:methylenetetrahydrofolate--tRNA-(uracil-5-)-methyltransferase